MSKQFEAVKEQVEYIGSAYCKVCKQDRNDVARFKTGIFANATICDTCCGLILRGYNKDKGGDAKE